MEKMIGRNGFKVLDHGYVALVDSMGSDLSVVRNARTSYDAEWRTGEDAGKDEKLIKYLAKNNHGTPFEAVTFTFEVKAPIFVFRQWHRHRTWAFSEISSRYSELPEEFYVPDYDQITTQSSSNKQMKTNEQHPAAHDIRMWMRKCNSDAFTLYKDLIALGTPRELARTVLPVATYSKMFATVSLRNLAAFLKLREHEHAQYEIRVYANAMHEIAKQVCPISIAALLEQEC